MKAFYLLRSKTIEINQLRPKLVKQTRHDISMQDTLIMYRTQRYRQNSEAASEEFPKHVHEVPCPEIGKAYSNLEVTGAFLTQ